MRSLPTDNSKNKQPPEAETTGAAGDAIPKLNLAKLEAARGGAPAVDAAWRTALVGLLNDSLATELVCVLRYKRHHYTAHGLASPRIAEEFMVHALEETTHADRIAKRIVQLGGEPDFEPESLSRRSHAAYDASPDLKSMIRANLVAENVAVEAYGQLVALIGERDPTTRRLIEDILADEQKHADELQGWLTT